MYEHIFYVTKCPAVFSITKRTYDFVQIFTSLIYILQVTTVLLLYQSSWT